MGDGSDARGGRPARERERARAGGGPAELGNALETLRVAATLIVVLYHAALTYVASPLRLTLWVAFERPGHVAFDTFVYWVNGFVMPAFFLAAGVSAPAACESRGPRAFLTHRVKRLLRPLLFASLTILPAFYLLWGYGLMVTGRCRLDDILSWEFAPEVRHNLYGLGHLWFLEYLFLVCALWCGLWWLRTRAFGRRAGAGERSRDRGQDGGDRASRWLAAPWSPVLLAVPTALIFLVDSDTMLRVDNVIVPNLARLVHYWWFFEVGGWLSRVREPRARLARSGPYLLGLSFVLFAAMAPLLLRHAAAPLGGTDRVVYCLTAALFPWLTVYGALGVLLRLNPAKGPVMRSLSESAFWMYLIHVPLVALAQLVLLPTGWPLPVKFAVVAALGLGVSLASYGPCVRHSLIGVVINGARKRAARPTRFGPEFGWASAVGVLLVLAVAAGWSARVFVFGHNLYAEVPGRLYRSARLKPAALEGLIGREGVRSVIVFTGGGERHPWFVGQKRVCAGRRVALHAVPLSGDLPPSREAVVGLIDLLARSPRPVLVEGYRGTDQVGFGAAVARLLDGSTPSEALGQFGLKYGQFSGAEHSALGRVLLAYRDWLASRGLAHTPGLLQAWARGVYAGGEGAPAPAPGAGTDLARGAAGPATRR